MALEIFELRWDRVFAIGGVSGAWRLWRRKPTRFAVWSYPRLDGWTKKMAIQAASHWVRESAPSQLLIYNRDGKIGSGGTAERSYGSDSRRRPG